MTVEVFDDHYCALGEGPLWHPLRQQLFWFDIIEKKLLSRVGEKTYEWSFDEHVSAAGWVDQDTLLIASESRLFTFNLDTEHQHTISLLDSDNAMTRSNDGRADPWGGFWIGTMGKKAEPNAGAIYRYYKGELRQLYAPLTIPNAICFSPDREVAYFADTEEDKIWRQALNSADGWPAGEAELFIDCALENVHPDGAVVDASGCLWNAQWEAARVACYSPAGDFIKGIAFPAKQMTCPVFGGDKLNVLYATSAYQGLSDAERKSDSAAGQTFVVQEEAQGQPEHQIQL